MSQDADLQTSGSSSNDVSSSQGGAASPKQTIVPQFTLDAADAKIASWSAAIVDAADLIDGMLEAETLPVPAAVRELAASTTQKLRDFGTASGEQQAADLVAGLQRTAAAHPAASISVGAAVGAALAALMIKLADPSKPTIPAANATPKGGSSQGTGGNSGSPKADSRSPDKN